MSTQVFFGGNLANYNRITKTELANYIFQPSVTLGQTFTVVPNQFKLSFFYDFKYNQSHLTVSSDFKLIDLNMGIKVIESNNDHLFELSTVYWF